MEIKCRGASPPTIQSISTQDRQRRDQPHVEGDDLQGVRDDQVGGERLGAPVRRRRTPADQPEAPRAEEGHGADDCYDRGEHPHDLRRRRAPARGAAVIPHEILSADWRVNPPTGV